MTAASLRGAISAYTKSQMAHNLASEVTLVSTAGATTPTFRSMETLLGGAVVLRARPRATVDWVEVVRRGLPAAAVDALTDAVHLTQSELSAALGISRRTLSRRKKEGLLTSEESAKLVRLARVVERAEEVFEGFDAALEWLKAPNAALTGVTPLSLLDTDLGAELVLDTLGRIEHGVFA